jgi:hypothetical protein
MLSTPKTGHPAMDGPADALPTDENAIITPAKRARQFSRDLNIRELFMQPNIPMILRGRQIKYFSLTKKYISKNIPLSSVLSLQGRGY